MRGLAISRRNWLSLANVPASSMPPDDCIQPRRPQGLQIAFAQQTFDLARRLRLPAFWQANDGVWQFTVSPTLYVAFGSNYANSLCPSNVRFRPIARKLQFRYRPTSVTADLRPLWPFSQAGTAPPKRTPRWRTLKAASGGKADIQDSQSFGRS